MAVDAVTVADCEQVKTLLTTHVGRECVGVLVHLIGVARLVATGCCEGKFSDCVEAFRPGSHACVDRLARSLPSTTLIGISTPLR